MMDDVKIIINTANKIDFFEEKGIILKILCIHQFPSSKWSYCYWQRRPRKKIRIKHAVFAFAFGSELDRSEILVLYLRLSLEKRIIFSVPKFASNRHKAVTKPLDYASQRSLFAIHIKLAFSWLASLAIALPIGVGYNWTPDRAHTPYTCRFFNSDFLIYSSIGSYYVPLILMIVLYARVFHTLRMRALAKMKKKQAARAKDDVIITPPAIDSDVTNGASVSTRLTALVCRESSSLSFF